jgi:hypothetical protein
METGATAINCDTFSIVSYELGDDASPLDHAFK